jgi:hypothetical protein
MKKMGREDGWRQRRDRNMFELRKIKRDGE